MALPGGETEYFLISQTQNCHMCDQAGDYWLGFRCEKRGSDVIMVRGWGEVAKMAAAAGASTVQGTVLQPVMSQSSTVLYCNAVSLGSTQILLVICKKGHFLPGLPAFSLSQTISPCLLIFQTLFSSVGTSALVFNITVFLCPMFSPS